jgi:hypothetical protein
MFLYLFYILREMKIADFLVELKILAYIISRP